MRKMIVLSLVLLGATSCGYKQPVGEMCGNAGAASFSIPKSEIYMWESGTLDVPPPAGKPGNISGAVLMLRWPDMVPRSNENYAEFNKSYMDSLGPTPWISIIMLRPDGLYSQTRISEQLSFKFEQIVRRGGVLDYKGDMYGLRHAVYQSAPGKSYEDKWFYWGDAGDGGAVRHYIYCGNAMPVRPPDKLRLCSDSFYMSEINMEISVNYRDNMLSDWSKIQQDVRAHLLSKIDECSAESFK